LFTFLQGKAFVLFIKILFPFPIIRIFSLLLLIDVIVDTVLSFIINSVLSFMLRWLLKKLSIFICDILCLIAEKYSPFYVIRIKIWLFLFFLFDLVVLLLIKYDNVICIVMALFYFLLKFIMLAYLFFVTSNILILIIVILIFALRLLKWLMNEIIRRLWWLEFWELFYLLFIIVIWNLGLVDLFFILILIE